MNEKINDTKRAQISPELVAKAKAGDQAAFTELYKQTSTELYRSIRSMIHDEDLAWDIEQDTYLRVYQNLDKLEANEAFLPWLRRISVNVTATQMRKRLPVSFSELSAEDKDQPELPDPSIDAQPELALDRKETSRLVREILAGLPEDQHLILGMRYYEDLSVKEIAELLHVAQGTVRGQLFRGRKKVETAVKALEQQGVKLYGLSPFAFLMALLHRMEPTEDAARKAMQDFTAKAGIAAGTKAAASAAAPVVLHATKPFFSTTLGKVILGVAAAAVVVGGAVGFRWARNNLFEKTAPILMVDSSEDLQNDPTAPTVPVEVDVTGPTLPVERDDTAEDLVSEPAVTEPSATEPTETQPVGTDPAVTEPLDPELYSGTCGENLTWRFDPNTGLLTIKGSGAMYDYNDERNGKFITRPWPYGGITAVSLPDGLTKIGAQAFQFCEALTSLSVPYSVTEIGDFAFSECGLSSVELSENLTKLGEAAFYHCRSLSSVTVPNGVTSIGESTFNGCLALSSVTLPNSLTTIADGAFYDCEKLSSVTIPDSVTAIDRAAFNGCLALQRVIIPDSVSSIGDSAFGFVGRDRVDGFTIFGYEGSAAERYAVENGFAFESLTENRDEIAEILLQEHHDDFTRLSKIIPIGTRYLAKVEYADPILATEEEFQQARQSGKIVLNGTEYRFTESLEEAKEWGYVSGGSNEVAWIAKDQSSADVYSVIAMEDGYGFKINAPYQRDATVMRGEYRDVGRIWLEADTEMIFSFFDGNLGEFFAYYMDVNHDADVVSSLIEPNFWLRVDENGTFYLIKTSEGTR